MELGRRPERDANSRGIRRTCRRVRELDQRPERRPCEPPAVLGVRSLWYPLDANGQIDHTRSIPARRTGCLWIDRRPRGFSEAQRGKSGGFVGTRTSWIMRAISLTPNRRRWEEDPICSRARFRWLRPQAHTSARGSSTRCCGRTASTTSPEERRAVGLGARPDLKMSKSKGNVVTPGPAPRARVGRCGLLGRERPAGTDTAFDTNQMKVGRRRDEAAQRRSSLSAAGQKAHQLAGRPRDAAQPG